MYKYPEDTLINFFYFLIFPTVFIGLLIIMLQCCSHLTPKEQANIEQVAEDVVETIIKDEVSQFSNVKKIV